MSEMTTCDTCKAFVEFLHRFSTNYEENNSKGNEPYILKRQEVECIFVYLQAWAQRQCTCCFKEVKNFERFQNATQCLINLALFLIKHIPEYIATNKSCVIEKVDENKSQDECLDSNLKVIGGDMEIKDKFIFGTYETGTDKWTLEEIDRLLHLASKVFLVEYPLYVVYKHSTLFKFDEITQLEVNGMGVFCDINDPDIPIYLIRNVCLFCKSSGIHSMILYFDEYGPDVLSPPLANAMLAVASNVKQWLNMRSLGLLYIPLRTKVLRYMCKLSDSDLRAPGIKNMADFLWTNVKEPLDTPLTFDKDGLDLAFKYFTSTTLTMRLAGITQINNHINLFNELSNNEAVLEVESVGQNLADWLISNRIVEHIFGPNLHVEVMKQSLIILNFLAMEGKLTREHIDAIWQAAQPKHCSKQVFDLLTPLIKNMEASPVMHLYNHLCAIEPKEHTEQSLFLASALIRFIWNSGGSYTNFLTKAPQTVLLKGQVGTIRVRDMSHLTNAVYSSSENSISVEASNSEEEQHDSSQLSETNQTQSEASEHQEGPKVCVQKKEKILRKSDKAEGENSKMDVSDEDESGEEKRRLLAIANKKRQALSRLTLDIQRPKTPAFRNRVAMNITHSSTNSSESHSDMDADTEKSGGEERSPFRKKVLKKRKDLKKVDNRTLDDSKVKESVEINILNKGGDGEASLLQTAQSFNVISPKESEETVNPEPKGKKVVLGMENAHMDHAVPNLTVYGTGSTAILKMVDCRSTSVASSETEDPSQSIVMTELANLVPFSGENEDRQQLDMDIDAPGELLQDVLLSGEEGSYSSRISNKSDKNMADFDGEEDSGCEEELVQLAQHAQLTNTMATLYSSRFQSKFASRQTIQNAARLFSQLKLENVCKPGNTLLWDLLQDDKIIQLGEGLATEAEKALCSLLCLNTEKLIRMKFIEGCLDNLSKNRSVVVSLRLLPKLFGSFQQMHSIDTHQVTIWAEKELHMTYHFFSNLEVFASEGPHLSLYTHQAEISARLNFLSAIYSAGGSPDTFRLSVEQMDILWHCLALDALSSDELFAWLLSQAKTKDQHALGEDILRHLYLRKLPSLPPETISMTGFFLYQQLCNHSRSLAVALVNREIKRLKSEVCNRIIMDGVLTISLESGTLKDAESTGMDHLWKIALRANNTDVSAAAIQYLNSLYIKRQLEQEEEFVTHCMGSLNVASEDLCKVEESSLLQIQRALLLLKSHLETFKKRYAYHMRHWLLEGCGISSHAQLSGECGALPLRIVVQPAGRPEKTTIELYSTDYVADLRAEISSWWESMQDKGMNQDKGNPTPVLGSLLSDGPLRLITHGQELTSDFDEKTLHEVGFKDLHLVYISLGTRSKKRLDVLDSPSSLPPPPRECVPMLLLLRPQYFEQLFDLMQTLSAMKTLDKGGKWVPHTKAQVLSRRVWDILMLLPTSPTLLEGFQELGTPGNECSESRLEALIDPNNPQKLMYSLHIIESLGKISSRARQSSGPHGSVDATSNINSTTIWSETFIENTGLQHLFDIFMSGALQGINSDWSEWQQDCLTCLLKLLCQFGVAPEDSEYLADHCLSAMTGDVATVFKKRKRFRKGSRDKLIVPKLSLILLQMIDVPSVMARITSILYEASLPRDPNYYKTGFWGRPQMVHSCMTFFVSWAYSCEDVCEALFSCETFPHWLRRLVLEDPDPAVRKEVSTELYRLCLGTTSDGRYAGMTFALPLLAHSLEYLAIAQSMRPQKVESLQQVIDDGKEPYGPASRDYFWLICRLFDSLDDTAIKESIEDPLGALIDVNTLIARLSSAIVSRDCFETDTMEDIGLIGMINFCTLIIKRDPPFKTSKEGQEFLHQIFHCLFALPTSEQRYLPKCKSLLSRSAAYDLLIEMTCGSLVNFIQLQEKLLLQHQPESHQPYPWDYWPHEDARSDCGYVGLTNLGATCYMASCMQHLFMMPQAREAILTAESRGDSMHKQMLKEMQRMFAYLQESERKAYDPRSFCKVYTMEEKPLNTGDQKDMTEFFINLVSKLEEISADLKKLVKTLFGGVLSNNVVSLDCPHVSSTVEEFYTVRCQVTDIRNLYESLNEVTVKDMLEGDNMYTCSQCGVKVRAEKRACFKKLPQVLCFNIMRYTFNYVTMQKEKVNTYFSFPLRLDMSEYIEKSLLPAQHQGSKLVSESQPNGTSETTEDNENLEYDLIGVTVHTGTADGGHYYSFIRDRTCIGKDKWFLFNDAEVKPFDPNQIAAECFGGEMLSKTYDTVTDKFMDLSLEKTNSAYMLFYERRFNKDSGQGGSKGDVQTIGEQMQTILHKPFTFPLTKDLVDWIWQDNMDFIREKNIFQHAYFNFMSQVCGYVPQTLMAQHDVTAVTTKLATSFFLETFIHAKEKPTMVQWIEMLTKQFNSSQASCEWFLDHMSTNDWWPMQILIKCPNQMVRQMFQRLCILVIQKLRPIHFHHYLEPLTSDNELTDQEKLAQIGSHSCVTRFVTKLLTLMETEAKLYLKHLTEYFTFLHEFSKMGEEECQFLIQIQCISTMITFYLGHKTQEQTESSHDNESQHEENVSAQAAQLDKCKPASLDKMITLVTTLVEKSRGDRRLHLSSEDLNAVAGGKGLPFLHQQIRDNINLQQTRNLIFSLCRFDEKLAVQIINMVFHGISKHGEASQPFFKILTLLTELLGTPPPGLQSYTQLVLQRIWEVASICPQATLEWLSLQVPRNKLAHTWVLQSMEQWVETFLVGNTNQRVRNAAAFLLVSLVPNIHFRQSYRSARSISSFHTKEPVINLPSDALAVFHQIFDFLLRLLKNTSHYIDPTIFGTTTLATYFALLTYCLISKTEKLKVGPYIADLWELFHPKLSEPNVACHHNKQAFLIFWHTACVDCSENIKIMLQDEHLTRNIAFNYILADHEDQEVIMFNRIMLPAYYGLLRLLCQHSRAYTRLLAVHQNVQWAFKNIAPFPTQYSVAVEELFKIMQLMVMKHPDASEQELHEVTNFRRQTLSSFLQVLDGRSCWATIISVFRVILDNTDDRMFVIFSGGITMMFEAFQSLHTMYHEATACHVMGDLMELLAIIVEAIKCIHTLRDIKEPKTILLGYKDWVESVKKLTTLLNSFNPAELRGLSMDLLQEIVLLIPHECLPVLIPLMTSCHMQYQENQSTQMPIGPYFPKRSKGPLGIKAATIITRPPRPMLQMAVPHGQLEACKGVDEEYDAAVTAYFKQYHLLVDVMCRTAFNVHCPSQALINLSALVGYEEAALHMTFFPKLWTDIYNTEYVDRKFLTFLLTNTYFDDYVEIVLLEERSSLNIDYIYNFMSIYFPKIESHVVSDDSCQLVPSLTSSLESAIVQLNSPKKLISLNGDLRALILVCNCGLQVSLPEELMTQLTDLHQLVSAAYGKEKASTEEIPSKKRKPNDSPTDGQCSSSSGNATAITEIGEANDPQALTTVVSKLTSEWLKILHQTLQDVFKLLEPKI